VAASTAQPTPFSVITLGTGTPRYDSLRAGPANAIRVGDRFILVDAGNGLQERLQQARITADLVSAVLITHHHLDHDQELIPYIITSLVRGYAPEVIGSPGTVSMMNFMREFYAEDIAYRMSRSPAADVDPASLRVRDVSGGERFTVADVSVRTAAVNHTIHTVAYRFDRNGESIVISGDLTLSPSLVELARGTDILVMDAGMLPSSAGRGREGRAGRAGRAGPAGRVGRAGAAVQQQRAHPSLDEIAAMASQAGVSCLVLTHIGQPLVDASATLAALRSGGYRGSVVIAEDLMEVAPACVVRR
jgi:ribonuclease BN (tRNA processing enzyme)